MVQIITSAENRTLKEIQQLKTKKYRDLYGRYVVEGPNLCVDALENDAPPVCLAVSESGLKKSEVNRIIEYYKGMNQGAFEKKFFIFEDRLFHKLAETEHNQGILAVVNKNTEEIDTFFDKCPTGNVVVLDRLQDPGNVGTIIRTADAAGYKGVILMKGNADIYSSKVVRACAGSLFRLPVLTVSQPDEAVNLLHEYGKKIVSTGFDTDKPYYQIDLKENIALIIGNEGNGICEEFKKSADEIIKIPMEGKIESLNASVAAGIIMYESMRQKKVEID